ncbi:MAG: ethanolamine utilization microcompartment protein EutL [Caldilinea sp.]|uniref:ethanolamine utilization microcompartment protein EutL n=1 Tax=Caldilinea sp. TaxID=2293560 RepID=UPI002C8FF68A|nr:ethanolamine utilization microcompartment protein EutL [Anaerolineales bacterium]HQY91847.1 ethanolamine utilization microcompartment protein EutL [Caldilinea sp.]
MAILDPIYATPLAIRLIPNVDRDFAEKLGLRPEQRSIGLITADNDDATYVAIDASTKMADVEVAYARSFYAGAKHASGLLSGEIMAILAGPDPAEVRAGLHAALAYMKHEAIWYAANADASIAFFPHLISRTGSFLSKVCGISLGSPIAYLVAPPMEGLVALDAALKAAAVRIAALTLPPSETNYMGVMLTGDQPACQAAVLAFQEAVLDVASEPIKF